MIVGVTVAFEPRVNSTFVVFIAIGSLCDLHTNSDMMGARLTGLLCLGGRNGNEKTRRRTSTTAAIGYATWEGSSSVSNQVTQEAFHLTPPPLLITTTIIPTFVSERFTRPARISARIASDAANAITSVSVRFPSSRRIHERKGDGLVCVNTRRKEFPGLTGDVGDPGFFEPKRAVLPLLDGSSVDRDGVLVGNPIDVDQRKLQRQESISTETVWTDPTKKPYDR